MSDDSVSGKDVEELRVLTAFFNRLAVTPTTIRKSECPDFFVHFVAETQTVVIGCELVRFHSELSSAARLEHLHRWQRFTTRLKTVLHDSGLGTFCGAIHPKGDDSAAFDALTRNEVASVAELVQVARRTNGMTSETITNFDASASPILAAYVGHIFLQNQPWDPQNDLWWWAPMQAGNVAKPLPTLDTIVQGKESKAQMWNWQNANERWLLVYGEGKALGDTMLLPKYMKVDIARAPAFTRVFAWDGLQERIYELLPSGRVVFEVERDGGRLIHMGPFPPLLEPFCEARH